jgi:hypothetical protein
MGTTKVSKIKQENHIREWSPIKNTWIISISNMFLHMMHNKQLSYVFWRQIWDALEIQLNEVNNNLLDHESFSLTNLSKKIMLQSCPSN